MYFLDEAVIYVKAGDGGPGCVSFRRERYVPRGGPDGGDGGRGGDVIFIVDPSLNTLSHFRRQKRFIAPNGEAGRGKSQHGRTGTDLVISVPPGTIIGDNETKAILKDLVSYGDKWIAVRGGKGGKGNERFKSSTRQAPRFAQKGQKGEEKWLLLELKLLADIGLVGEPNAGKSTFLSSITSATPKIADYPFTTTHPILGVAEIGNEISIVIADIPGLIEGAHKGIGMGHQFLKHIERTRALIFLIDITKGPAGIKDSFNTLWRELKGYNASLIERPFAIALNKIDLLPDNEVKDILRAVDTMNLMQSPKGTGIFPISAATSKGVRNLLIALYNTLYNKM